MTANVASVTVVYTGPEEAFAMRNLPASVTLDELRAIVRLRRGKPCGDELRPEVKRWVEEIYAD